MHNRLLLPSLVILAILATFAPLPADDEFKSGPQPGSLLPGPFECVVFNDKQTKALKDDKDSLDQKKKELAKKRLHCLVCDFGLNPVVMVLAREVGEGKEGPLHQLLKKLDEAGEKHQERYLSNFVVFLSPDARSSATDPKLDDPAKLVEEAMARDALFARLDALVQKMDFKHLVVSCYLAEGPKGYNLNDKAEVTVVFYLKHKVVANFAFAEGKFKEENIEPILQKVEATLAAGKKKPPLKKKL